MDLAKVASVAYSEAKTRSEGAEKYIQGEGAETASVASPLGVIRLYSDDVHP